jgi:2-phosphoglycerate kinase
VENLSIENTSDAAVEIVANRVSGIAERAGRHASAMLLDGSTPRHGIPVTRAKSG